MRKQLFLVLTFLAIPALTRTRRRSTSCPSRTAGHATSAAASAEAMRQAQQHLNKPRSKLNKLL